MSQAKTSQVEEMEMLTSTHLEDIGAREHSSLSEEQHDLSKGMKFGQNAPTGESESSAPGHNAATPIHLEIIPPFMPIAICGMACRLPGGISSPVELWDFLMSKGDARSPVPGTRFNINAYHSATKKPGMTVADHGYFLDDTNDLGALDTSFFSMPKVEVERLDPQQRLLLEVARESLDDAGEVNWKGRNIGVYVGSFAQDWYDLISGETQSYGVYQISGTHDFMLSNRLSYELDLRGPSVTIRTACSADLTGLNEACLAISRGDCESAIVGGSNLVMSPSTILAESEQGVLSAEASCNTFSANAHGYSRGEAVVSVFVKSLSNAVRDGNPIRAVITGAAINSDGKTHGITTPSSDAQESMIKRAYEVAGVRDFSGTAFVECHGTGTKVGDPIEVEAVGRVFGNSMNSTYIGSVKANLGHSEGASGLTALLKVVLALQNKTIPPQIKAWPLNPTIPFARYNLLVPDAPTPWPAAHGSLLRRASINSFGVGGSNAHIVVESPDSHHGPSSAPETAQPRAGKNAPQLLLFSANKPQSLHQLAIRYQDFLEKTDSSLLDIAYTLASRREHLPFRSFSVATRDVLGTPSSSSTGKPDRKPELIMVFTGQGAQWAQMGKGLLVTHVTFRETIRKLDEFLAATIHNGAGPGWKLEEELLRPARTSRINEAEFSQPICTAVQIALVDAFAAIGIEPTAVIGHSSGEICAAYAAKAITAQHAITIAFHRGHFASLQTKKGSMAVVSLSWDTVADFLAPGVQLACDNSPHSVTISGDTETLQETAAVISKAHPDIPVTILRVDKAYHSHHMASVGKGYYQAMVDSGVSGTAPSKPFFSSVTGELLLFDDVSFDSLGPEYWKRNLEQPVLFRGALLNLLESPDIVNPVFLEVGPHSALSAPLRQTLLHVGSQAPYVTSLTRRSKSDEDFLSAVGKLYTLHVTMNMASLVPQGQCIPDLPRYPWDHSRSYWYESRTTKARRLREFAYHDLLGVKVTESTDMEPLWRNLFHLDNAPWVGDHRINGMIVFPFACYISMAAEAIRQISRGAGDEVSLRKVVVNTALIMDATKPTELITSFHPHHLTELTESKWWKFSICSHNGHVWTKHCTGEVTMSNEHFSAQHMIKNKHLPRLVDVKKTYEASKRGGLDYGPNFQVLKKVTTSTSGAQQGAAIVENMWHGEDAMYHVHPIILDSFFQLLTLSASHGLPYGGHRFVPVRVGSMTMIRRTVDSVSISAFAHGLENKITGNGFVVDECSRSPVISFSDVHLHHLGGHGADDNDEQIPTTARSNWVPHIDFQSVETLFGSVGDHRAYIGDLDTLADLAVELSARSAMKLQKASHRMASFQTWLQKQRPPFLKMTDETSMRIKMESLTKFVSNTPGACAAEAINYVCANMNGLLMEEAAALDTLYREDIVSKVRDLISDLDNTGFLRCLAHSTPNLRVLELDALPGVTTAQLLRQFRHEDGHILYSQFLSTNPASQAIRRIGDEFKSTLNFKTRLLDITKDLSGQGFADEKFDLIISSGFHNSPDWRVGLANALTLLAPNGRLLLELPRPDIKWIKYVFGTQPEWARGLDEKDSSQSSVTTTSWTQRLKTTGFGEAVVFSPHSPNNQRLSQIIVARPTRTVTRDSCVTLLCMDVTAVPSSLISALQVREFVVSIRRYDEEPSLWAGHDVMVLVDRERPFIANMTELEFERLKRIVHVASQTGTGIFWITEPFSVVCDKPDFGSVVGLSRALRAETSVEFATCEVDDLDESVDLVTDTFIQFHTRNEDSECMGPDTEYSIQDGVARVHRIFPFELGARPKVDHQHTKKESALRVGRSGRLETLHWKEIPAQAPEVQEVEIEVHSAGLNFRDILLAMGLIETSAMSFGHEVAGIVRRVGPQVTSIRIGDRVLANCTQGLATVVQVHEANCETLPDELSFTEGASMPVVYTTAIYSLIDIGNLRQGQTILIHSGAGGVGLAAIQVAQAVGAVIYTTVSSDEKAEYLVSTFGIARNCIFNSRNASFADDLLRETAGRGADLVLNSLGGELLHTTWRRCVAKWGTMVEIGKRDLLEVGKLDMDVFLANRSYRCVDMHQMGLERPVITKRLFQKSMEYYRRGLIRPIRIAEAIRAAHVSDAFRYMQQGKHIGKVIIDIRDKKGELLLGDTVPARPLLSVDLDPEGSCLLVGGLGGLGRSISIWLVQRGARHLVFLSRSAGHGEQYHNFAREIESMGCSIQLVKGSVSELPDVERAIDQAESRKPVKGVIQMSMVLRDQAFEKMSLRDWEQVRTPKVQGTWNLHNALLAKKIGVDFFLLFSSISGVLGQPGQANYASANGFLDAFVQYRRGRGMPCTAIDLGAVEDAGYLTDNQGLLRKMQGLGWRPVRETEVRDAMHHALFPPPLPSNVHGIVVDSDRFLLGVAPTISLSSPNSSARLRRDVRMAAYHNDRAIIADAESMDGHSKLTNFLMRAKADSAAVLGQGSDTATRFLATEIGGRLFSLLLRSGEEVNIAMSLTELGLDSLVAIELRAWWKATFSFDITVLEMIATGTLEALGQRAVDGLRALYD